MVNIALGSSNQTIIPTNKTIAATIASAIGPALSGLIIVYLNKDGTISVSTAEASAITSATTALITLVIAWLVPPGKNEFIIQHASGPRSAR